MCKTHSLFSFSVFLPKINYSRAEGAERNPRLSSGRARAARARTIPKPQRSAWAGAVPARALPRRRAPRRTSAAACT